MTLNVNTGGQYDKPILGFANLYKVKKNVFQMIIHKLELLAKLDPSCIFSFGKDTFYAYFYPHQFSHILFSQLKRISKYR